MTALLRWARVGARAPAEAEPAGDPGSAARGPATPAASSGPRTAVSPPGEGNQGIRAMGRRPQPLLGRGESKARGSRSAPWLRGTSRRGGGGAKPPGPQHRPGAAGGRGGRPGRPGGGRRRRGTGRGPRRGTAQARARWGLRGRLGLAARAALRRWTGPPAHTEGTRSWLLPRGAASLARWLRVGAGRRARPVARPESVESGLRAAANPQRRSPGPPCLLRGPRPRPAPVPPLSRPTEPPPMAQAPQGPAYILPPRRRLRPRPLRSRPSRLWLAQAPCHPARHKKRLQQRVPTRRCLRWSS